MGVEEPDEQRRREALWDPPPQPGPPREEPPVPGSLSNRARAIVGAVVGVFYAVTLGVNGDLLPGLVGGVLLGILCFVVLRAFEHQRAAKRRRRNT
jgi:hypothetical protein